MSRKVTIRVAREGVLVDGPLTDRPVRVLPGGNSGVVYLGQVYPLHHGDVIDLADVAIDKDDCRGFVDLHEPVNYAPPRSPSTGLIDSWYIENNRFGSYLVFDAGPEAAEDVVAKLQQSALGVRNWGISHRPADNGVRYDYYVRLGQSTDPDAAEAALFEIPGLLRSAPKTADCLPQPSSGPLPGDADAEVAGIAGLTMSELVAIVTTATETIRHELEGLLAKRDEQISEVTVERDAAVLQAHDLSLRVAELEALVSEANDSVARLRAGVESARRREAAAAEQAKAAMEHASTLLASTGRRDNRLENLTTQLSQERARTEVLADEARAAQELAEEAEEARLELRRGYLALERRERDSGSQLRALQDEAAALRAELLEALQDREDRERRRNSAPAQDRVHPLNDFCPRLVFGSDDLAIIDHSFRIRAELFDVLLDLDRNTKRYPTKNTGVGDVQEVVRHIATGQVSDRGRVYFRRLGDNRLFVAIHVKRDKKEQQRFMERFASASEPGLLAESA